MDGLKDVVSLLTALVGLISALIPLFGYMADRRRRASALAEARAEAPRVVPEHSAEHSPGVERTAEIHEWASPSHRLPPSDSAAFARAQKLVRNPAIAMIVVGALSLTTNLMTAGIGYIDEFVTPLGIKPARNFPAQGPPNAPFGQVPMQPEMPGDDRGTMVLGIIGILFFSFASAVAIWSGCSMLKLRNYWLALAGSVALMPGSCMCCLLGLPSGIWSFVTLMNPEVRDAFR